MLGENDSSEGRRDASGSETVRPVTGKPAEMHHGVYGNSVSPRFPPIIERIGNRLTRVS